MGPYLSAGLPLCLGPVRLALAEQLGLPVEALRLRLQEGSEVGCLPGGGLGLGKTACLHAHSRAEGHGEEDGLE